MPGFEEVKNADQMPVMPQGAESIEDPMTEGLVTQTDDSVKALLGKKLD